MDAIYQQLIANKQKAVIAFVVGFVATYLAKYGFDIETLTVKQLVEQILYGVVGYVSVFLKRNK